MKCPVCKTADLVMSERQSVEIDYCPECRGVWLDRGELDKILDRAQREFAASANAAPPGPGSPGSTAPPATGGPAMTPTGRPRKLDDSDVYPAIGGQYQGTPQQSAPHHPHQPPPYYYKKKKHWLLELLD